MAIEVNPFTLQKIGKSSNWSLKYEPKEVGSSLREAIPTLISKQNDSYSVDGDTPSSIILMPPKVLKHLDFLRSIRSTIAQAWRSRMNDIISDPNEYYRSLILAGSKDERGLKSAGRSSYINPFVQYLPTFDCINFDAFSSTWVMPQIWLLRGELKNIQNYVEDDGNTIKQRKEHVALCDARALRLLLKNDFLRTHIVDERAALAPKSRVKYSEYILDDAALGQALHFKELIRTQADGVPSKIEVMSGLYLDFELQNPQDWVSAGSYPESFAMYMVHKLILGGAYKNKPFIRDTLNNYLSNIHNKAKFLNNIVNKI